MLMAGLGDFGRLAVFDTTFVAKIAAFLGLGFAGSGFSVLVSLFLGEARQLP